MRTVFYFDLLGISALNSENVEEAAHALNQFSLVLEAGCRHQTWENGFHLSDSTILTSADADKAIDEAAELWKHFFHHNVYDFGDLIDNVAAHPMVAIGETERWEALRCLPRGCLAYGDIRLLPALQWQEGHGFRRSERRVLVDTSHVPTQTLRVSLGDVSEITFRDVSGQDATDLVIPRQAAGERVLAIVGLDSSQDSQFFHIGKIGNITGTAVVRAVKSAELSGLKGPRLLLDDSVNPIIANRRDIQSIPGTNIRDVLWNADFEEPSKSALYLRKAFQLACENRNKPTVFKHYAALVAVTAAGVVVSHTANNHLEGLGAILRDLVRGGPKLIELYDERGQTSTAMEQVVSLISPMVAALEEHCGIKPAECAPSSFPSDASEYRSRVAEFLRPQAKS